MNYIGDLSKYDYEVLKELSSTSIEILEFGVGASTQILRNFSVGNLTSIETSEFWIDITKKNLEFLNINKYVRFFMYQDFNPDLEEYDFVFNDGVDSLRSEFGIKVWKNIKVGGVIAYHDTRRSKDIENVIELVNQFKDEVDSVIFNVNNSNITIVKKKMKDSVIYNDNIDIQHILREFPYYDWNNTEKKIRLNYGVSINQGFDIPDFLI
jgi:predicted O-methyltransferase YrrM